MKRRFVFRPRSLLWLPLVAVASCTNGRGRESTDRTSGGLVKEIGSEEEFRTIFAGTSGPLRGVPTDRGKSEDRLLVLDLYADWCPPCRMLSPILEQVALESEEKASFFKLDVDRFPRIAAVLGMTGIPYVVFARNGSVLHSLTGVRPKDTYLRVIERLSEPARGRIAGKPDGQLVEGVRVVTIEPGAEPLELYVYRGDTVKLIIGKKDYPFSVHIPQFGVSKETEKGKALEVVFKAKTVGAFPMFCNGDCPAGDGAKHATIIVMQYETSQGTLYKEVSAKEARDLIESRDPLVLDVRTPREFYGGHLKDAKLIPVQQLEARISEIEDHKDKEILLYCRSGNRSTVAAEILRRNGFTKLYNMRHGIRGWLQEGYETVR